MEKGELIKQRETIVHPSSIERLFNKMKDEEDDERYYREMPKYTELIWDGRPFKAYKNPKSIDDVIFKKGFTLFSMVRNNALTWLKARDNIVPTIPIYPVNFTNEDYDIDNKELAAIDINSAYWTIAKLTGIISEKTYERGMRMESVEFKGEIKSGDIYKMVRLSSLSVLGKKKTYYKIKNGEKTKEPVQIGGHEGLENVYKYIRYTCYWHMYNVSQLLGNDFCCWKTDCVYFHNTRANIKKVRAYFDKEGLEYKMVVKPKEKPKEDLA